MNRGPGRHQSLVLAMVDAVTTAEGAPGWVTVDDVLHLEHAQTLRLAGRDALQRIRPSDREVVRRAMRTLAAKGAVEVGDLSRERHVDAGGWSYSRGWYSVLGVRRPWTDPDRLAAAEVELERREQSLVSRDWAHLTGFMQKHRDDQAAHVAELRLSVEAASALAIGSPSAV